MSTLRVWMYHKITENEPDFLSVKRVDFAKQIEFIAKNYDPIKLSQLLKHLSSGEQLPDKAALITFDDGYLNNFDLAYPILKKMNIPFTVFLVGNYIGQTTSHDGKVQKFLSTENILEMSDLAEYAYHSLNHTNLNDSGNMLEEITDCIRHFEQYPFKMQPFWAYTYGAFPKKNPEKFKALVSAFETHQIKGAFRIGNRLNSLPIRKPFAIERIDVRGDDSFLKFRLKSKWGKIF